MTFDVLTHYHRYREFGWKNYYEVYSACRKCNKPTAFLLSQNSTTLDPFDKRGAIPEGALNSYCTVEGFVSLKDFRAADCPAHVPKEIQGVFTEGATCLAAQCFNAAGTMFRLCLDMVTRALLPNPAPPNLDANTRRNLSGRIRWLLDNGLLPEALRDLSSCVREDGNDGAHAGTLKKEDAEDLLDFTIRLLERLYTEPKQIELAQQRRAARRGTPAPSTKAST